MHVRRRDIASTMEPVSALVERLGDVPFDVEIGKVKGGVASLEP